MTAAKCKSGQSRARTGTHNKNISREQQSDIHHKRNTIIAFAGIYLLLVIFFAPVVFKGMGLSPAADMVASAGMYKMGEEAIASGKFPLWNPTLFCGLPMFASLQYALFTYPPEYPIRLISYVFGGGNYRIWLFHYFLAAIFAYLLARHYRCGKVASWLAGVAYGFSPQLIVLADVGHGSKLMGMTYLPLIWLMLDRLRIKPSIGRALGLGAVYAIEILALHPQVAAYGGLMMGIYLIYYGVTAVVRKQSEAVEEEANRKNASKLRRFGRLTTFWCISLVIALLISAVLWVSVLDFSRYSVRGAAAAETLAGGTGTWKYATGWSFHPFESITFLFPHFMGFGGQTYWGTVGTPDGKPFTHNPMYFGCIVLMLAAIAAAVTPRSRWGFPVALGVIALILSFGRYLPVVYGPLYNLLPFFNKFRAPVMGQVLLLLPMSILAAMGFEELRNRLKTDVSKERLIKGLLITAGVFGFMAVFSLMGESVFNGFYRSFALGLMPETNPGVLTEAMNHARTDVARVGGILAILLVIIAMTLRGRIIPVVMSSAIIAGFLIDIYPINRKMIGERNFTPKSYQKQLFQDEYVIRKLKKDNDIYRVHLMDTRYRAANWWSYFGIESTAGYFGAKMAQWQQLNETVGMDGWNVVFTRPRILDALNVRYIISSYPLDTIFAEFEKRGSGSPAVPAKEFRMEIMPRDRRGGSGAFVYRNPGELSRVRLVGDYRVVSDQTAMLNEMVSGNWDPGRETLLEKKPEHTPNPDDVSKARILSYEPEEIKIKTSSLSPQLLVLADSYYPSGWTATVDGQNVEILRADGLLRAVSLPAGDHDVVFTFKPRLFYAGLWISLVTVIGMVGWFVFWFVKGRNSVIPA